MEAYDSDQSSDTTQDNIEDVEDIPPDATTTIGKAHVEKSENVHFGNKIFVNLNISEEYSSKLVELLKAADLDTIIKVGSKDSSNKSDAINDETLQSNINLENKQNGDMYSKADNIRTDSIDTDFQQTTQNDVYLEIPKNETSVVAQNTSLQDISNCVEKSTKFNKRENSMMNKRVQISDNRDTWLLLENSYCERYDFKLGIKNCKHYESNQGVMVELSHGQNFEIYLGKHANYMCNVDINVNGLSVAKIQMKQDQREVYIKGPVSVGSDTQRKFVFFRTKDAPSEADIDIKCPENGLVEAKFMPELPRLRKRGFDWEDVLTKTRSVSLDDWTSGAVALQGSTTAPKYTQAEEMEIDENAIIVVRLRMVSRRDDTSNEISKEKIVPLYESAVPPLPPD